MRRPVHAVRASKRSTALRGILSICAMVRRRGMNVNRVRGESQVESRGDRSRARSDEKGVMLPGKGPWKGPCSSLSMYTRTAVAQAAQAAHEVRDHVQRP